MTPLWYRVWKIIYNTVPAQNIGLFEIIKNNGDITLIEHSDPQVNWMGNCGDEWRLYRRFRRAATGDVLIAGLGLGLDLLQIAMKRDVKKIVVVEKKQIIIDLVWPYIPHHRATLVHQDIRLYLRETKQKFDVIYFDIFPGGGESFPVTTAELRKLATPRLKPNGRIIFFREFLVSDDTRRTGET